MKIGLHMEDGAPGEGVRRIAITVAGDEAYLATEGYTASPEGAVEVASALNSIIVGLYEELGVGHNTMDSLCRFHSAVMGTSAAALCPICRSGAKQGMSVESTVTGFGQRKSFNPQPIK